MLRHILSWRFARNYFSTLLFIAIGYWAITRFSHFHQGILQARWDFQPLGIDGALTVRQLFIALIVLYAIVLVPYYAHYRWLHSKSFVFLRGAFLALRRRTYRDSRALPARARGLHDCAPLPVRPRVSRRTKQAGLVLLLKFYFAPLMLNWCLAHIADLTHSLLNARHGIEGGLPFRMLFDGGLYWALFQLILFVDTFLFTLGYILESPRLRNRIRSVEPTFFGWFICLACYPPFNEFTGRFLPWQSTDFPQFDHDVLHVTLNVAILVSLTIFSWASVALGFKASNLTNRGIVTHGPYAFVRHPAYAAKTLAWLLGALPVTYLAFASDWRNGLYAVAVFGGWTLIYILRALTEERHLLMLNNGYTQYMNRVKHRFIPGLI
jgi:protein-S-isoprenylcysteine O-methyltransferase Ste14